MFAGEISCGRQLKIPDESTANISTFLGAKPPKEDELEPTAGVLSPDDLLEGDRGSKLYLSFDLLTEPSAQPETEDDQTGNGNDVDIDFVRHAQTDPARSEVPGPTHAVNPPKKNAFDFLMSKALSYPALKVSAVNKNVQQFNAFVEYLKVKKWGVRNSFLSDFTDLVKSFSSLLWELDCHYEKMKKRGGSVPKDFEKFFGLNNPKAHGHAIPKFEPLRFSLAIKTVVQNLDRPFMEGPALKTLKIMMEKTVEFVSHYMDYLEMQRERNAMPVDSEDCSEVVDDFVVTEIKTMRGTPVWREKFQPIHDLLCEKDWYKPIIVNDNMPISSRQNLYVAIQHLKSEGFPFECPFKLRHYRLAARGCKTAVHFLWKEQKDDPDVDAKNRLVVDQIRRGMSVILRRADKKAIKEKLARIGVIKSSTAELIMRYVMGDDSAPFQSSQRALIERFDTANSLGKCLFSENSNQ